MALIRHQMKNCPHLKLILMSATVHSQMIMSYFAPCALVSVSGRVFPVQDYYIDDVYSLIRVGQMMQSGISTPSSLPDDLLCLPRTSTKQIHFRVSEEVIVEFTIRLIQRENNLKAVGELNCASGETILIFLPGIQVIDKVHRLFRSRQILSSLKATVFFESLMNLTNSL